MPPASLASSVLPSPGHPLQIHVLLAAPGAPSQTLKCLEDVWWPCGPGGWKEAEAWVCPAQNHRLPPLPRPAPGSWGLEAPRGGLQWEPGGASQWGGPNLEHCSVECPPLE